MSTLNNRHRTGKRMRLIGMTSEQAHQRLRYVSRKPSRRPFYFARTVRRGFVGLWKVRLAEKRAKEGLRLPSWLASTFRRAR